MSTQTMQRTEMTLDEYDELSTLMLHMRAMVETVGHATTSEVEPPPRALMWACEGITKMMDRADELVKKAYPRQGNQVGSTTEQQATAPE